MKNYIQKETRKANTKRDRGALNILVRRNRLSGREETVCPVEWKP